MQYIPAFAIHEFPRSSQNMQGFQGPCKPNFQIQGFSRSRIKSRIFKGLENPIFEFKGFQGFQGPVRTLYMLNQFNPNAVVLVCTWKCMKAHFRLAYMLSATRCFCRQFVVLVFFVFERILPVVCVLVSTSMHAIE